MWNAMIESLVILKLLADLGKEIGKMIGTAISALVGLIVMGIKTLMEKG